MVIVLLTIAEVSVSGIRDNMWMLPDPNGRCFQMVAHFASVVKREQTQPKNIKICS